MQKREPLWVRIINGLSEASGYISGFLILLASLIVLYQVTIRYFIGASTIWQTELSIYLLLFAAFVGAAYGLKHDAHVGIDVLTEIISAKARSIVKIITSFFSMILTIILAWKAWGMWYEATINGWHSSSVWGPSLTYPYIILPIGMSLVSLQFIVIMYQEFVAIKSGTIATSQGPEAIIADDSSHS